MKTAISDPAWNNTEPNKLLVLCIKYPHAMPRRNVNRTKTTVYWVYATVPRPATVWLNENIIACNTFEYLGPNKRSYFFRKRPLYNNSSLTPFAITMINIHGDQEITRSRFRFRPWNKKVASGIDITAKSKKPIRPIMSPSLRFPLSIKSVDILSPEIRDNIIIGIIISNVLDTILMTKMLIGVVWKLRKTVVACKLIAKVAMKKENKTFQYFLRRTFLNGTNANKKKIIERLILYIKS